MHTAFSHPPSIQGTKLSLDHPFSLSSWFLSFYLGGEFEGPRKNKLEGCQDKQKIFCGRKIFDLKDLETFFYLLHQHVFLKQNNKTKPKKEEMEQVLAIKCVNIVKEGGLLGIYLSINSTNKKKRYVKINLNNIK